MQDKKKFTVTLYPTICVIKEKIEAETAEAALKAFYSWWRSLDGQQSKLLPEGTIAIEQAGADHATWVEVHAAPMSLSDMVELVASTYTEPDLKLFDKTRLH
jgi:hypothetical protein